MCNDQESSQRPCFGTGPRCRQAREGQPGHRVVLYVTTRGGSALGRKDCGGLPHAQSRGSHVQGRPEDGPGG